MFVILIKDDSLAGCFNLSDEAAGIVVKMGQAEETDASDTSTGPSALWEPAALLANLAAKQDGAEPPYLSVVPGHESE